MSNSLLLPGKAAVCAPCVALMLSANSNSAEITRERHNQGMTEPTVGDYEQLRLLEDSLPTVARGAIARQRTYARDEPRYDSALGLRRELQTQPVTREQARRVPYIGLLLSPGEAGVSIGAALSAANRPTRASRSLPGGHLVSALAGRCSRWQKCSSLIDIGALLAVLDPAGWSSPIARRKVA